MKTLKVTQELSLSVFDCCICGIVFGVPEAILTTRHETGEVIFCPNGHRLGYEETSTDKLRKAEEQLREARADNEWWKQIANEAQVELRTTRASLRGTRAAHTRTKNRIANGICPCCHRQFQNLHRHMEKQHPNYAGGEIL